ncbi:hypothetical protein STEG23_003028 [Scotinomys teguina]
MKKRDMGGGDPLLTMFPLGEMRNQRHLRDRMLPQLRLCTSTQAEGEDPIWVPRRLTRILKDASMDDDVPAEPADALDEPTAGEDGAKMGDPYEKSTEYTFAQLSCQELEEQIPNCKPTMWNAKIHCARNQSSLVEHCEENENAIAQPRLVYPLAILKAGPLVLLRVQQQLCPVFYVQPERMNCYSNVLAVIIADSLEPEKSTQSV